MVDKPKERSTLYGKFEFKVKSNLQFPKYYLNLYANGLFAAAGDGSPPQ